MIKCQMIPEDEARICIIENKYSAEELMAELGDMKLYRDGYNRLKNENRRKDFLALRLALKRVLGGEVKKIVYTDEGKPLLSDESYKISFSHCQSCVAVIIHPQREVGIDVEVPSDKLVKIHSRFLGENEMEFYRNNESFDFLRIAWSVKEALYKIIGDEAYNFAEQLQILPFEIKQEGTLYATHTDTGKKYKVNYKLTESYTLAYSIEDE